MRRRGWSAVDVAKRLGVAHTSVGDWLKGARPRAGTAKRIAHVFEVPVELLLDDSLDLPEPPAVRSDPEGAAALQDSYREVESEMAVVREPIDKASHPTHDLLYYMESQAAEIRRLHEALARIEAQLTRLTRHKPKPPP